ncbi:MAG: YHS domain protein [Cyclobacteriaceae bacterium]|nr:YHS domain protein [Cyclobacteriaceae bacterium]
MRKLIIILVLGASFQAIAQTAEQKNYNIDKNGIAIDGYDPVSYFNGKPEEGNKEISSTLDGVTYLFANEDNKFEFEKAPLKYIPQYGGWCAYAMGLKPEKVKVDPETYKIVNGKLYLFYNFYLTNTLKSWNKDETRLKTNADKNWDSIINK